jgi:predicted component of type VI protein secretion system
MDIKLVGFKPNGDRFEIPLTEQSIVMGRGEDCDVRVPISSISRRHCEFSVEGGHVRARDLGSANGTFINNNRVSEVRLSAGDRVVLGSLVMTLQIDGQPAEIPSPEVLAPAGAAADVPTQDAAGLEEDIATEAVPLDEAPIDLGGSAAGADDGAGDEGPISLADEEGAVSLADEPAPADAFADLVAEETGDAASASDVFGGSVDEEIDPIAALEMLAGETEKPSPADMLGAPEDIEVAEAPENTAASEDTGAPEDTEAPKDLEPGQ